MNETTIRANLSIADYVQVQDPAGQLWTIVLVRPNEPRSPWERGASTYAPAALHLLGDTHCRLERFLLRVGRGSYRRRAAINGQITRQDLDVPRSVPTKQATQAIEGDDEH